MTDGSEKCQSAVLNSDVGMVADAKNNCIAFITPKRGLKHMELLPVRPDLEEYISKEDCLQTALLRCLASIVTSDGTVNFSEYEVLGQIINQSEQPVLAAHIVHRFLEKPVEPKNAFAKLGKFVSTDDEMRKSAFAVVLPVLKLQGSQSKKLAQDLAKALNMNLSDHELNDIESGATATTLVNCFQRSKRMILDSFRPET